MMWSSWHRVVSCTALLALSSCRSSPTVDDGVHRGLRPLWSASAGGLSTTLFVPVITTQAVVVGGEDKLVGLDPASGRVLWSLPVNFQIPYAGVVAVSDSLAALVAGDGVVVFDPRTGRASFTWTSPTPDNRPSGAIPKVLADGRVIYVTRQNHVVALDARSARLDTLVQLPNDTTRNSFISAIAVHQDTLYVPVTSDARRGARYKNTMPYRFAVGTRRLDSLAPDPSDSASLARWMHATPDLLVSATDYDEPSWLGFSRQTGARVWKVGAESGSLGPGAQVAIVGDTMFAGGNDGFGYVIQVSSGRLIRRFPIPRGLTSGVAACRAGVFINVVGNLTFMPSNSQQRIAVNSDTPDFPGYNSNFAVGNGIAVIGSTDASWTAYRCEPP